MHISAISSEEPTIVCVQIPLSTSHVRTVESNPQLYATRPSWENTAFDTRAVCDFRTVTGAFLLASTSSRATFLRFLRALSVSSCGTSSVSGITVSQRPIKPSHDAVKRCDPDTFEAIDASGALCRWSEASGTAGAFFVWPGASERRVRRAVRSCEALATRCVCASSWDGT